MHKVCGAINWLDFISVSPRQRLLDVEDKFGAPSERKRFSHQIGSVLGKLPSFNLSTTPPQLNSFESFPKEKWLRRKTRTKGESYYSINNLRSLRSVLGERQMSPEAKSDQHRTFHHARLQLWGERFRGKSSMLLQSCPTSTTGIGKKLN